MKKSNQIFMQLISTEHSQRNTTFLLHFCPLISSLLSVYYLQHWNKSNFAWALEYTEYHWKTEHDAQARNEMAKSNTKQRHIDKKKSSTIIPPCSVHKVIVSILKAKNEYNGTMGTN